MKLVGLLVIAAVMGACGEDGPGGGAVFDTTSPRDGAAGDTAAADSVADQDAASSDVTADTAADAADSGAPPDVGADVLTGDKAVGTPCAADAECQSGICLASSLGSACTAACAAEADCDGYPIGMFCLPVRPGRSGCVPEGSPPPATCEGHADCPYPLYCRPDGVGCDLPECLHDGDCQGDDVCEPATRRCQPRLCTSDLDCKHPALTCADDQSCAPPECEADADCGGAPAYCHPIQKECKTPATCEDEDGCFYNESCVGGFCLPDLCYAPCSGERVCDPASGWCGAACSGAGQGSCADGETCLPSGVCKPNQAPIAVVAVDGGGASVVVVAVGEAVTLTGAGSLDPEGEALSFHWTVLAAPSASALTVAEAVGGDAATVSVAADAAGRFVIGLIVRDPAGLDSVQAAATIVAR